MLFVDFQDTLNAGQPIRNVTSIPHRKLETYSHLEELHGLSFLSNISNSVKDIKVKNNYGFFKDKPRKKTGEKPYLQFNR